MRLEFKQAAFRDAEHCFAWKGCMRDSIELELLGGTEAKVAHSAIKIQESLNLSSAGVLSVA